MVIQNNPTKLSVKNDPLFIRVDVKIRELEKKKTIKTDELSAINSCLRAIGQLKPRETGDDKALLDLLGRIHRLVKDDSEMKISDDSILSVWTSKIYMIPQKEAEKIGRKIGRLTHHIRHPEKAKQIQEKWQAAGKKAKVIGRGTAANPEARMLSESYWVEALPIKLPPLHGQPEQTIHIYKEKADHYRSEWKKSHMKTHSFEDYMYQVVGPKLTKEEHADLVEHNVRYLEPGERLEKAVTFEHGVAMQNGKPIPAGEYMIVLDARKEVLHISEKIQGKFHHSSFERGGAAAAAGIVKINDKGRMDWVLPYSGHYRPTQKEMDTLRGYLMERVGPKELAAIDFINTKSVKNITGTVIQLFHKFTNNRFK